MRGKESGGERRKQERATIFSRIYVTISVVAIYLTFPFH
jgi:hypothetical protein